MPKILFIEYNGTEHLIEAESEKSVMQNAVDNEVPGIVGDCGGGCACATCQGYIDPAWIHKLPSISDAEEITLEGSTQVKQNSRLTCQIIFTPELDGIVVRLPASQF